MKQRVLEYIGYTHNKIVTGENGFCPSYIAMLFKDDPEWEIELLGNSIKFLNKKHMMQSADRRKYVLIHAPEPIFAIDTQCKIRSAKTRFNCILKWTRRVLRHVLTRDMIEYIFKEHLHYTCWMKDTYFTFSCGTTQEQLKSVFPSDCNIDILANMINVRYSNLFKEEHLIQDRTEVSIENILFGDAEQTMADEFAQVSCQRLVKDALTRSEYLSLQQPELNIGKLTNHDGLTLRQLIETKRHGLIKENMLEYLDFFEARRAFLTGLN